MNYWISKSKKSSTIMVYPANGYIGYMICKELSSHHSSNDAQNMEVLAICCGEGGMYDRLKDMGKPIKKIIVLNDAFRMSEWKKELKDLKCDAMMLCAEGAPQHHKTRRMASLEERGKEEGLKKFTNSIENALEMARHMECKSVTVTTAFAADESNYKTWNQIYKTMEKACKKNFKGNYAVLFHNMMFECLYLNREEITRENLVSWPVSEDAKFCPMSAMDLAQCCICVMKKMMQNEKMIMGSGGISQTFKKFHVTGRDKMTPGDMMDMMSNSLNMELQYNEVNRKEWSRMMEKEGMLSYLEICLAEEVFDMMGRGNLKKCTDECKKLTNHTPMRCEEWLDEHRDKFQ